MKYYISTRELNRGIDLEGRSAEQSAAFHSALLRKRKIHVDEGM